MSLEFSIKTSAIEKLKTACLVIGVFAEKAFAPSADTPTHNQALNIASDGLLQNIVARGDLDEKVGASLMLHQVPGIAAQRLLLVSLGKCSEFDSKAFRSASLATGKVLANSHATDAVVALAEYDVANSSTEKKIRTLAQCIEEASYRFDPPRAKKDNKTKGAKKIDLWLSGRTTESVKTALTQGQAIGRGSSLARDLGNLPPNICTPTYLANQAKTLAKTHKIRVEILDRPALQKLGMGSFLSVTQGSHEPPKFIVLEYKGNAASKARSAAPIVLVGKGITFDAGGISLKPGEGMDEMKYDMCGAASVLGTFQAIAEMKLPIHVVGLIPSTENMPGGSALKPGDVVRSMSGQTIEILNTDAEGRLILCDALTYAERFKPDCVIDIATLTGACVIALGHHPSGLMSNNDDFARELVDIGQQCGDRAWQMPLWDEYQDQLKSNFADMANIGGRPGGSITAACFLSRFTKAYKWAHLDIAGTAWKSGAEKGATGRPVPLLTHFLMARAKAI